MDDKPAAPVALIVLRGAIYRALIDSEHGGNFNETRARAAKIAEELLPKVQCVPAVAAPEGYRLVPVEPTEAMKRAARQASKKYRRIGAPKIYRAMLAASPAVVLAPPEDEKQQQIRGASSGPLADSDSQHALGGEPDVHSVGAKKHHVRGMPFECVTATGCPPNTTCDYCQQNHTGEDTGPPSDEELMAAVQWFVGASAAQPHTRYGRRLVTELQRLRTPQTEREADLLHWLKRVTQQRNDALDERDRALGRSI